ncbi:MAG: hypothetical protein M3066_16615 [Actinomycetota bacterium]|nr:hypothetical protein [Actinomycetota bacterium]
MREPDLAAAALLDAGQNVLERRFLSQALQFGSQVLLQRLASLLSPSLKFGMDVLRKVSHQDIRHAYGVIAMRSTRKAALYADACATTVGFPFYPGSLNLVLDEPLPLPPQRITVNEEEVGRDIYLVPCSLGARRCFIFRRDEFGVDDGDTIEVVIDDPVGWMPIPGPAQARSATAVGLLRESGGPRTATDLPGSRAPPPPVQGLQVGREAWSISMPTTSATLFMSTS